MTILEVLPVTSMYGVPFTDYLNTTSPSEYEEEIKGRVIPVIESLGRFTETEGGVYRLLDEKLRQLGGRSSSASGARWLLLLRQGLP